MRDQLFTVSASLDRERREKEEVLARLAATSISASVSVYSDAAASSPPLQSAESFTFPQHRNASPDFMAGPSPVLAIPTPTITPATPLPDTDPDIQFQDSDSNHERIKAWGFPRLPSKATRPTNKRESFFGLSSIPRRASGSESVEDSPTHDGLDLPPFMISDIRAPTFQRAASQPIPAFTGHVQAVRSASLTMSASSATSSALSFFSSYLPLSVTSPSGVRPSLPRSPSDGSASSVHSSVPSMTKHQDELALGLVGGLDFRKGCQCCVGDVIEY